MALKSEVYYHWVEVLFKSILLHCDVKFALIYDNDEYYRKYNLDNIVDYPIFKKDIINPYTFKYELIKHTPFDNTIYFDADTIILKDITPLFNEQFVSVCGEWDKEWIYNDYSPFSPNPEKIVEKYNLNKLYSTYSGYIRFEKNDFYYDVFKKIILNKHYNKQISKIYNRGFMPDEYFLNMSISDLELKKFIPIKLYYSKTEDGLEHYYGYTFQGNNDIKLINLETVIGEVITKIGIRSYMLGSSKYNQQKELNNSKITMKTNDKLI
jgi:hypothetical protein